MAFWFEKNEHSGELIYCEIPIEDDVPAEKPEKIKIRLNDDLTSLLDDPKKTFFFSLARINTADGEPIRVFSKPKGVAASSKNANKQLSLLASLHQKD